MNFSLIKLLSSFSVQIDEGINEIGNASTNVEKVNKLVIKIKVKIVGHILLEISFLPVKLFIESLLNYWQSYYNENKRVNVFQNVK